jgi:hypothetical protein
LVVVVLRGIIRVWALLYWIFSWLLHDLLTLRLIRRNLPLNGCVKYWVTLGGLLSRALPDRLMQATDYHGATTIPEIDRDLGRLSSICSWPKSGASNFLRQLCPRTRPEARARFSTGRQFSVVPAGLPANRSTTRR